MKQCHHERRLNRRMTILSFAAAAAKEDFIRKFPKNARPSLILVVKLAAI